jgi:hypothetical protein
MNAPNSAATLHMATVVLETPHRGNAQEISFTKIIGVDGKFYECTFPTPEMNTLPDEIRMLKTSEVEMIPGFEEALQIAEAHGHWEK